MTFYIHCHLHKTLLNILSIHKNLITWQIFLTSTVMTVIWINAKRRLTLLDWSEFILGTRLSVSYNTINFRLIFFFYTFPLLIANRLLSYITFIKVPFPPTFLAPTPMHTPLLSQFIFVPHLKINWFIRDKEKKLTNQNCIKQTNKRKRT